MFSTNSRDILKYYLSSLTETDEPFLRKTGELSLFEIFPAKVESSTLSWLFDYQCLLDTFLDVQKVSFDLTLVGKMRIANRSLKKAVICLKNIKTILVLLGTCIVNKNCNWNSNMNKIFFKYSQMVMFRSMIH